MASVDAPGAAGGRPGALIRCLSVVMPSLLLLLAQGAWAQNPPLWRWWKGTDGMPESFTVAVTATPGGVVWARHGDVPFMSSLDGYGLRTVPNFRSPDRAATQSAVYETSGGQLWTLDPTGLRRYENDRWVIHPVGEIAGMPRTEQGTSFVPVDSDRVLIVLPDRLIEYSAATRNTRTVKTAAGAGMGRLNQVTRARDGSIWLAAEGGIGKLGRTAGSSEYSRWSAFESRSHGLGDLRELFEGDNGEWFAAGLAAASRQKVLVRFDGRSWHTLYTSGKEPLRGWRGADNSVWVQDGNALLRLSGGRKELVDGGGRPVGLYPRRFP